MRSSCYSACVGCVICCLIACAEGAGALRSLDSDRGPAEPSLANAGEGALLDADDAGASDGCDDGGSDATCRAGGEPAGAAPAATGEVGGDEAPAVSDPGRDSDGDGAADAEDACPDDANKTRPGPCGCGVTDTDVDGDGALDCEDACPEDPNKLDDPGVCGCGEAEDDADGDGAADCEDACPQDPAKTEPGACGCGRSDADRSGDGAADCLIAEDARVSAGFTHSCAVGSDGKARCWGAGGYGRLGHGETTASPVPVLVGGLSDVLQVSSRGFDDAATSCAVLRAGGVRCWGYGGNGTMGNGQTTATNPLPVVVGGLNDALQVSVGNRHVCAVREDGSIVCWGQGSWGKLGNGSTSQATQPVAVQAIDDAVQVSAGYGHTCAVRAEGQVYCWGDRGNGRLGDGGDVAGNQLTPALVSGLDDAVQVSAGYQHSCAVRAGGGVVCWGLRNDGRLGDGGDVVGNQATPVNVTGVEGALQVSAGLRHSCAVLATGGVMCWGLRTGGRLGDGTASAGAQATAIAVTGIGDAVQVSAGYEHSCAARASGEVLCWGAGGSGRLGDGSTARADAPVEVTGIL